MDMKNTFSHKCDTPFDKKSLTSLIVHIEEAPLSNTSITYVGKYRNHSYSHKDIVGYSKKLSNFLFEKGVRKGDKIVICAANCPEWFAFLLCAELYGVILIPTSPNSAAELRHAIIKHAQPKLIFTDKEELFSEVSYETHLTTNLFKTINELSTTPIYPLDKSHLDTDPIEIYYTGYAETNIQPNIVQRKDIYLKLATLIESSENITFNNTLLLCPFHILDNQIVGILLPLYCTFSVFIPRSKKKSTLTKIVLDQSIACIIDEENVLGYLLKILQPASNNVVQFSKFSSLSIQRFTTIDIRKNVCASLHTIISSTPIDGFAKTYFRSIGITTVHRHNNTFTSPLSSTTNSPNSTSIIKKSIINLLLICYGVLTLFFKTKNKDEMGGQSDVKHILNSKINFIRPLVTPIFKNVVLRWIFKVNIKCKHPINALPNEPVIYVANHCSHLDTFSILFTLPPSIRYSIGVTAAADFFFDKTSFFQHFFNFYLNVYPFFRTQKIRKNFRNIGTILNNGNSILMYPEGTRSRNGLMDHFKPGIGIITQEMNVPIVPIGVKNAFTVLPYDKKLPKKGTIEIIYGDPIDCTGKTAEEISLILEGAVRNLCS